MARRTPTRNYVFGMPRGVAGVAATLGVMRTLTRESKILTEIRNSAIMLSRGLLQKDRLGEITALFNFVKYEIRYVRDISGYETVQTPSKTLELRAGDCDDKSTILASLLEAIGYTTRFVAVGFTVGTYVHVLVQVELAGTWLSLDATEPHPMGWFPPGVRSVMYSEK